MQSIVHVPQDIICSQEETWKQPAGYMQGCLESMCEGNLANDPQRWSCCRDKSGGALGMVEEGQAPTPHGETAGAGLDTKSENIEIIKSGAV